MTDPWYYRPIGPYVDGRNGYEWNVTVPDMAGTQSILKIKDGVLYARATYTDGRTRRNQSWRRSIRYQLNNIKKDASGKYPTSISNMWAPVNRTFDGTILNGFIDSDILPIFVKEQMEWYGYQRPEQAQ